MTLPWWDWSKDAAIPSAYSSAQADGAENVLAKAPIKAFNTAHKSGWPTETSARSRRSTAHAGPAIPAGVGLRAFNKHGDTEGVLRFKQLTLLTYA